MTVTYNFDRSLDQRRKRYDELEAKKVSKADARYCVVTTGDGYNGDFTAGFSTDRYYFTNKRTAIAFAQHYSDIFDHYVGVFRMPEFIAGVSCR